MVKQKFNLNKKSLFKLNHQYKNKKIQLVVMEVRKKNNNHLLMKLKFIQICQNQKQYKNVQDHKNHI